ncbi:MAG: LysM peptidoglycan-binding domain-containing protein [Polyangiaceae bacterium]
MTTLPMKKRALRALAAGFVVFAVSSDASAFPYTAQRGDTLADLAEKFYGKVEMEQVLVAANGFEERVALLPGMRIEIPAVSHHTVRGKDSWESIAEAELGDPRRGEALALSNDTMPWLAPELGREILIPYPLRYVARPGDSTLQIAYRFLGKRDLAYVIDRFNHLKGHPIEPGDVVLVPLSDLVLTDEGRDAAAKSVALVGGEARGDDRDAQDRADRELPLLEGEIRSGAWLDAISRGNQLLGAGEPTDAQGARIQRALLEAYVALGSTDLARKSCEEWRRFDPDAPLDPMETSPKVIRACAGILTAPSVGAIGADAAPSASASASASRPTRPRPGGAP